MPIWTETDCKGCKTNGAVRLIRRINQNLTFSAGNSCMYMDEVETQYSSWWETPDSTDRRHNNINMCHRARPQPGKKNHVIKPFSGTDSSKFTPSRAVVVNLWRNTSSKEASMEALRQRRGYPVCCRRRELI
jgi:hypothetical protein